MTDPKPTPNGRYVNAYAKAALPLFPLKKWDATVYNPKTHEHEKAGKIPLLKAWRFDEPLLPARAERWMQTGGNIGVRLTKDWLIVDFDPRNAGPEPQKVWDAFIKRYGIVLGRYAVARTGSGGYHVYMRNPKQLSVHKNLHEFPGIDFLTEGRYVVACGSLHPDTGQEYRLVQGSIEFFAAAAAPEGLFNSLKIAEPKKAADDGTRFGDVGIDGVEAMLAHLDPVNYGKNDSWFQLMCSVHFLSGGNAEDEWAEWCRGDPAYDSDADEAKVRARWRSLSTSADHKMMNRTQLYRELSLYGKDHVIPRPKVGGEWAEVLDAKDEAYFAELNKQKAIVDDDGEVIGVERQTPTEAAEAVEELTDDGDRIVRKFDSMYAMVLHGGKAQIVMWEPETVAISTVENEWSSQAGTLSPSFLQQANIRETLHPERIEIVMPGDKGAKVCYEFDYWRAATKRRFRGTQYAPGEPPEIKRGEGQVLNLWRGWPYNIEKLEQAAVNDELPSTDIIEEFIRDVIAAGDPAVEQYVLNWLAFGYQKPNQPLGVMLVLQGGQGEGKGTLSEIWRAPWGANGFAASNPDDVFSRFSGHLLNKSAVYLDEAFWAGDQGKLGRLKAMITEPTISIEAKGLNIVETLNTMKFMAASNEDWVVPADVDNRRFQVIEVSSAWKGKTEKWAALRAEMDAGGKAAFFFKMLTRDIKGWNPQRDRVRTEAMRRQARITQGPIAEWLHELYNNGVPYALEMDGKLFVPSKEIVKAFKLFSEESRTSRWKFSLNTTFEHEIKQILGKGAAMSKRVRAPKTFIAKLNSGGRDLMSPWDEQGRCYCYEWPGYDAGRKAMREKFTFNEMDGELDFSDAEPVKTEPTNEWDDII